MSMNSTPTANIVALPSPNQQERHEWANEEQEALTEVFAVLRAAAMRRLREEKKRRQMLRLIENGG